MKQNVTALKYSDLSGDVFIITPTQVDKIAQIFSDEMAEAMNVRPLSQKIRQIANETLTKVLQHSKYMGE